MRGLQIYVTVKATNGAGASTTATSNGIYLSYLSQGLPTLGPVVVWDQDRLDGDLWVIMKMISMMVSELVS